jgi:hypothetical protein
MGLALRARDGRRRGGHGGYGYGGNGTEQTSWEFGVEARA